MRELIYSNVEAVIKLENHHFATSIETPDSGYAHQWIKSSDERLTEPFTAGAPGRHRLNPPSPQHHHSLTRERGGPGTPRVHP